MFARRQIFLLGVVHFYALFFVAKYFEYIYFPFEGLFVLFGIQILSFFTNIWQPLISKYRIALFPVFALSALSLSLSHLGQSLAFPVGASVLIFIFIQSEILRRLKAFSEGVQYGYCFEIAGGLCGTILYSLCSSQFGFQGFVLLTTLIVGFVVFEEYKRSWVAFGLLILAGVGFYSPEPQPLVNKRQRYEYLQEGTRLATRWNPNGHVELLQTSMLPNNYLLSFEGGSLRSHIFHFDGNYEQLRADYLNGKGTGVWALDVTLPHFLKRDQGSRVALISCVGGQEILAAKAFGAKEIDVIDINGSAQELVRDFAKSYSGDIYASPVNVFTEDGRSFLKKANKSYDVIQIYSAESSSLASALGSFFRPSSLVTKEALQEYAHRLKDDGILQITMGISQKVKATFVAAFGEDIFAKENKLLILKPVGKDLSLVTFLYKKDGWDASNVQEILKFLGQDQQKSWVILHNPIDKNISDLAAQEMESSEGLFLKPSTDNWPFLRLVTPPLQYWPVALLAIALMGILFLLIPFNTKSVSIVTKCGAFLMGVTYSMAQSVLIIQLPKMVGLPSLGLCVAVAWCLVLSGIAAVVKRSFFPGGVFIILGLLLAPLSFVSLKLTLVCLSLLIFMQSLSFVRIIIRHSGQLNYIFWYNGLGFSCGIVIFNLIFILFGFWQALLGLSVLYLLSHLQTVRAAQNENLP